MSTISRIFNCMLGVPSPVQVAALLYGFPEETRTWLERWERRIDEQFVLRMPVEDGEPGPYVCPGCYVVASRCAIGCPEGEREESDCDLCDDEEVPR
jgi:hypothetical protein